VVLNPGAECSVNRVSLTALMELVQSYTAIPDGRKYFLLIRDIGQRDIGERDFG
jgi:hypothetical protein